jgi:hypothetical protein
MPALIKSDPSIDRLPSAFNFCHCFSAALVAFKEVDKWEAACAIPKLPQANFFSQNLNSGVLERSGQLYYIESIVVFNLVTLSGVGNCSGSGNRDGVLTRRFNGSITKHRS